ncbi:MAG TPA: hypothetical protein VF487_04950 [Chitinophagaceae bacterium]
MEPHRNIAHNSKKHPARLRDENLCFYVPQPALTKEGWFKTGVGSFNPIVTKEYK